MPSCVTINGRAFPCKTGIGGIKQVWIAEWQEGLWGALSAGEIADAAVSVTFRSFELNKNSGSLAQTINASMENGTVYFSQVVTMVMPIIDANSNSELAGLAQGRLAIVVEDMNGNKLIMGHTAGAEASGGEVTTGTGRGDLNGYNLQFTAEESTPAPLLGGNPTNAQFVAGS